MSDRAVIVTGATGGIGAAIVRHMRAAGHVVVGIDAVEGNDCDGVRQLRFDLETLADEDAVQRLGREVRSAIDALGASKIIALVNNAAWQGLGAAESLPEPVFSRSLAVNVTAPFVLSKLFFAELAANAGCIVNIGSIHAHLTKSGFAAYATSKAALAGLTRALSVEWGARVRVNSIEPAAVATPMLEAGFAGDPEGREQLAAAHPSRGIGDPDLVARWVGHLVGDTSPFCNGMVINLDGGIAHRLFDPGR